VCGLLGSRRCVWCGRVELVLFVCCLLRSLPWQQSLSVVTSALTSGEAELS
jgi:hypothetical protein